VEDLLLPLPEQSEEDEELRQAPHCNQSINQLTGQNVSFSPFHPIPSHRSQIIFIVEL
jgi:hypothetical protein